MHYMLLLIALVLACACPVLSQQDRREAELELLHSLEIQPDELMPLHLDTPIVDGGEPRAVICHADDRAWSEAARVVQTAVRQATGAELPMVTDGALSFEEADGQSVILLGHLDNNRHVARLYHNFFVCLDTAYAGADGYVIRSVHDPWGEGHNVLLVGGSTAEGTARAAEAFAEVIADAPAGDSLTLGRQMVLEIGGEAMTAEERDAAIELGRERLFAPGEGRRGVARLIAHGVAYHRTGDPMEGAVYRAMMHALAEYFETDEYIATMPLSRYDRDFRDAWTYRVGVTWDLLEESGLFSDEERLRFTNLVLRLMVECDLYQGYERRLEHWRENTDVPHNHNTFPALGAYFVGSYFKRHYGQNSRLMERADMWLEIAEGVFRGLKHSPKPLEDAASYVWLPMMHVMTYSLAGGDTTWFDEGHGRETAEVAMMVMDNAGYQSAYGDHSAYKATSGIADCIFKIAWYYRDPEILWMTEHAGGSNGHPFGQTYALDIEPRAPAEHVGLTVADLPPAAYDEGIRRSPYPTEPKVPLERCFNKMSFRAGLDESDAYLLLDGFGRGTHMHWDANAIIRYAHGGEPLLVDGEYIKNAPKYHSSLVIIRDGRSQDAPAVTELLRAEELEAVCFAQTRLPEYNGTSWTRAIVWRPNDYVLVSDEVEALEAADYTLRCCWRPWGHAELEAGTCTVMHRPMRLQVMNLDGAPSSIEEMKMVGNMPVFRLSQQVTRPMEVGDSYRFANVIHSHAQDRPREVAARRVGRGLFVVERPEGAEVIALGPEGLAAMGIDGEAEMVLLGEDLLVTTGATELSPDGPAELRFAAGDAPEQIAAIRERVLAMPAAAATEMGAGVEAPELAQAWEAGGFEAPLETLPVASISADREPYGRYEPVDKLIDGMFSSSYHSVMWPDGETVTITAELPGETEISTIMLREWHMSEDWDIGRRRLWISSDGFQEDVRDLGTPFEDVGTERFGGNVNTLMEAQVHQRARQVRLTISPDREDSRVYLAELEIRGTQPGERARITAMASGDLTGDGRTEVVVGAESGQIRALSAEGEALWTADELDRSQINALACMDLDGDGRASVIFGNNMATLGRISPDAELLWEITPPRYRGIDSDVMTILPADLDGDGTPEIVIGCRSWQYMAYDADGQMLWKNIIYAHSATVGHADDFDGDGLPEIVGGNAYYRLNLIDQDGTRIFSASRFGPEQTAVGSADVDGDDLAEILVGTDLGELLCFDGDGSGLWEQNVGDRVTAIIPADLDGDGVEEIVVAAESANVYAFDADGEPVWRTPLPGGVGDMIRLPGDEPRFVAAAGAAGVAIIDGDGEVLAMGPADARALSVSLVGGRVAVTTTAGLVHAFDLPG
ncbi:MAG: PQQ-binding-like beta-propeller repeat protein [Armatimonadota bacterium]|nr:PQQ-binding-like beta-propeller repeat protein [Armatimonadota bacterium]